MASSNNTNTTTSSSNTTTSSSSSSNNNQGSSTSGTSTSQSLLNESISPVLTLPIPSQLDADVLLQQRKYNELYIQCEERELNDGGSVSSNNNHQDQYFIMQLISAALINDLITAKLVWKRIPADIKKRTPLLKSIWKCITHLINKTFPPFYAEANTLLSQPNQLLTKTIVLALTTLVNETQSNLTEVVAKSYINLPIDTLNNYWGTNKTESIQKARSLGWTIDETTGFITPIRPASAKDTQTSVDQLNELTNYVLQLEAE